ncbi:hypothetical protein [Streptomyces sp. SID486]|uniref:hypothetical protein n=1 Tax=Streptomyces sp. SID486 TaxID=2690264 RepID=UPI001F1AC6D4|nr:hypothetical protein [Streptomyces sp. SID486]
MMTNGAGRIWPRTLPVALLAVLAAGCGTQRAAEATAGDVPSQAVTTPSTPADHLCPGESPSPPAPSAPTSSTPPTDHYAENHGFMVPFTLHGDRRCQGLAAVGRVRKALRPLREKGGFTLESVSHTIAGLGYSKVRTYADGSAVGFLIEVDDYPVCVEGSVGPAETEADAFGGYPDTTGCEQPSGGH